MNRNLFQFDDTYWRQFVGTAMGTPFACSYAILSYDLYELHKVLPLFVDSIGYLKRFIDDMLVIWVGTEEKEWVRFKKALNGFGKFTWRTSNRSTEVIFLDLRIRISPQGYIETTTYKKPMNLHLYIPGLSSHPAGCLKGTIFGDATQYWNQNTHIGSFTNLMDDFAQHLKNRGHDMSAVETIMLEAAKRIDNVIQSNNKLQKKQQKTNYTRTLYLHWQYHPCYITKNAIRKAYTTTLMGKDGFDNMRICFSRPQNLRDLLTTSTLNDSGKGKMSTIIESVEKKHEKQNYDPVD
jgi:hypothetical protein